MKDSKFSHIGKTISKVIAIAGCALLLDSAAIAAPTFTNSSFETGNTSGWVNIAPTFGVSNWTSLTGQPAAAGTYAYWMGATDGGGADHLKQAVGGFTVGNSYTLNFAMVPESGANTGRPGAFLLADMIGASVTNTRFSALTTDPNCSTFFVCAPGWQNKSLTFLANASTVDFDFHGDVVTSPSWEIGLDNFRLTDNGAPQNDAEVPEPSTLALFALTLLGLSAIRGRKRRN